MKALPLKLWLELEDSVNRHKAEIAQGFADARARLLPEPPKLPRQDAQAEFSRRQMEMLTNAYSPWHNFPQHQANALSLGAGRGLFGLGVLGL